eukprot:6807673-Prymnesium_polylepis.1
MALLQMRSAEDISCAGYNPNTFKTSTAKMSILTCTPLFHQDTHRSQALNRAVPRPIGRWVERMNMTGPWEGGRDPK